MIDHCMVYATEAAARLDPLMAPYWNGTSWDASRCVVGALAWKPSQDVVTVVNGVNAVTHTPVDSNFRVIIALPAQDMNLTNSAACWMVLDRDAAVAGNHWVLKVPGSAIQFVQMQVQPTFLGSAYPWGTYK